MDAGGVRLRARTRFDDHRRTCVRPPVQAQFVAAVSKGDVALARERLAGGANVDATDETGTPVLNRLIREGDADGVRLLLDLGADPTRGDAKGRTALHEAALARNDQWLALLLEHGVAVDVPNTRNGQTALYEALRSREQKNVDRLLAAGAKLDVRDRSGTTPLHQAALVNDIPSVKRFMEASADPRATDDTGATVESYLHYGRPRSAGRSRTAGLRVDPRARGRYDHALIDALSIARHSAKARTHWLGFEWLRASCVRWRLEGPSSQR